MNRRFFLFAAVICLLTLLVLVLVRFMPKYRIKDFRLYTPDENIYTVVGGDYIFENCPIVKNDTVYLPIKLVQKHIDKHIFYQDNELTITDKTNVTKMNVGDLYYNKNGKKLSVSNSIVVENDTVYLPSDLLQKFYSVNIDYKDKYKLVTIDLSNSKHKIGKLKKNTNMRYLPDRKSFVAQKLRRNDSVIIFSKENDYWRVRSDDGLVGYVRTKDIKDINVIESGKIKTVKETKRKSDEKIKMAWDQVANKTANAYAAQRKIPNALNVVSPTWFLLESDDFGDVKFVNFSDKVYVDNAHNNDCQVWASVSDNLNYKINHAVISDLDKRNELIDLLIESISDYDLDGINVDFEAVSKDDVEFYHQFLRELSARMKGFNAVLSVDVFVPQAWSKYYDRKQLAQIADYICVMAYDEYDSSSKEAGPVASINFVSSAIKRTLKEVPQQKILLGLPFYVRVWREAGSKISMKNMSLYTGFNLFRKHNAKFMWLDSQKYNYGEYSVYENGQNVIYKTWLEDEESLKEKLKLVEKFNIAGVAAWKKSFATQGVWDLLNQYVK